jgi:hypothetical protein
MDQNNIGSVPLARPYTWEELIAGFLPSRLRYLLFPNLPIAHWPEADLAIASSLVAQCVNKREVLVRALKRARSVAESIPSFVRSRIGKRFAAKTFSA